MTASLLVLTLTALGAASAVSASAQRPPFAVEIVGFTVTFNKERSPYRVVAVFTLPGEEITFGVEPGHPGQRFQPSWGDGQVPMTALGGWPRYLTWCCASAWCSSSSHGPFVHVDARGFRARWGD